MRTNRTNWQLLSIYFESPTTHEAATNTTTELTSSNPATSETSSTSWGAITITATDSATSYPTTSEPSTANESETISTLDSSTSEPIRPTTTGSLTTQEVTTTSTTASSTLIPTTKTPTTSGESTNKFTTHSTTANAPATTASTTNQESEIISTLDTTTLEPITALTTALETTTKSTTDSTTPVPTTTQSTVKIFVTDADTNNKIFVADLQAGRDDFVFTAIQSSSEPRYITYDSVDHKIYWTDKGRKRVYRADVDGENRETITRQSDDELLGIAIAETSRNLYIANKGSKKITSLSIGEGNSFPREETEFVKDLDEEVYSLEVDEEQGYLYWSQKYDIQRKQLDGSGSIETVFHDGDLSEIYGLSIDLSRDPRRIFICDFGEERTFYFDVNTAGNAGGTQLTNHLQVTGSSDGGTKLRDISFFNGVLYWAKEDSPSSIAVMTNYEHSNRSFKIYQTSQIGKPHQLIIFTLDE